MVRKGMCRTECKKVAWLLNEIFRRRQEIFVLITKWLFQDVLIFVLNHFLQLLIIQICILLKKEYIYISQIQLETFASIPWAIETVFSSKLQRCTSKLLRWYLHLLVVKCHEKASLYFRSGSPQIRNNCRKITGNIN